VRILTLLLLALLSLNAQNIKKQAIERIDLQDGTTLLRIHFNYKDSFKKITRVRGTDGYYKLAFPLPSKWEVLQAKGYIKYTPSILLFKNLSSVVVSFDDVVLAQSPIFDNAQSGIKFNIDSTLFNKNNMLKLEVIQHYINKCEDPGHSSLWSDIDLAHSYLELHVRPRPIKELISSIKSDVFDDKQYSVTPINYVVDTKDDASLKNFALFSSVASSNLRYKLEEIKVSPKLDMKNHNLIIASKAQARELLRGLSNKYISDETPSLSMFFNSNTSSAWLNTNAYAHIVPDESVKIVKEGAYNGKSLYLNDNRVALENMKIKDNDGVSVAFYFKPEESKRSILFGFKHYSLMLFNGYIGFNTGNKDLYGVKYNFENNKWYHVMATFHNGEVDKNSIMINGELQHLKQISSHFVSDNAHLSATAYIGSSKRTTHVSYKGFVDQFYMFDHVINTMSAHKLYNYSQEHHESRATESLYLDDKLAHDINVIQNPEHIDKAIIVLAPNDPKRLREIVYALYKSDLEKYKRQGLDIDKVTIAKPAAAYSAKDFVPLGEKIYFKELGYKTKFIKGRYPPKINLNFKVYPDNYFDPKDKIKTRFHYILPSVVHNDSVINIFLNGAFANQVSIDEATSKSRLETTVDKLFNYDSTDTMPAYLIAKGHNKLHLDFSLVPLKTGACEDFNQENLVASVLDDSYFILPKGSRWIEMPNMEYINNAQYPYSVYPDLQDTVILLSNKEDATIASAMNFIFFLTQELESHPNYLKITTKLSEEDKEKNIIVFGSIYDKELQNMSKTAPIVFDEKSMKKDYPYIKRFIENKSIINKDRLKKYSFLTSMEETNLVDNSIIMQMARSPYDDDKTLLLFSANNPISLDKGVNSLFKYTNRNNIQGDTLIYDYEDEEGAAYNLKDKYILSNFTWLHKLALWLNANPIYYFIAFILLLLVFVWLVRMMLRKFKEEHHKDAE